MSVLLPLTYKMTKTICVLTLCPNTSKKSPGLSFHRFPREEKIRLKWLKWTSMIERRHVELAKSSCLCSDHFDPKLYTSKGRLMSFAVPTKWLGEDRPLEETLRESVFTFDIPKEEQIASEEILLTTLEDNCVQTMKICQCPCFCGVRNQEGASQKEAATINDAHSRQLEPPGSPPTTLVQTGARKTRTETELLQNGNPVDPRSGDTTCCTMQSDTRSEENVVDAFLPAPTEEIPPDLDDFNETELIAQHAGSSSPCQSRTQRNKRKDSVNPSPHCFATPQMSMIMYARLKEKLFSSRKNSYNLARKNKILTSKIKNLNEVITQLQNDLKLLNGEDAKELRVRKNGPRLQ